MFLKIKNHLKLLERIVLLEKMGKASFFHIRETDMETYKAYIKQDNVGVRENYSIFRCLADLGDICGLEGTAMVTKTGELTPFALIILSFNKSFKAYLKKFHGLTDVEERYKKKICRSLL